MKKSDNTLMYQWKYTCKEHEHILFQLERKCTALESSSGSIKTRRGKGKYMISEITWVSKSPGYIMNNLIVNIKHRNTNSWIAILSLHSF